MNNGIKYALTFILGAAAGSVVTWKLIKTKYEQITQEEIESVKEVFSYRQGSDDTEQEIENDVEEDELTEADVVKVNYRQLTADYSSEEGGSDMIGAKPYVISPEEFGEEDDYDTESLIYYADDVLTDDQDNVIKDRDKLIGKGSLTHFGEYEDDSVFVRNEETMTDYEILRDTRKYSDVTGDSDPEDE